MDKVARYRELVKQAFCRSPYYVHGSPNPQIETLFFCDETHDLYSLVDLGWRDYDRVVNTLLLVRIKDEKIWVEEDWTEEGVANEFLRAGVPKEDIVLAFHHPSTRKYTEFAAA